MIEFLLGVALGMVVTGVAYLKADIRMFKEFEDEFEAMKRELKRKGQIT